MGSTGDPPVPAGDSPTGAGSDGMFKGGTRARKVAFGIPPGQWPGGTGESPVLPWNWEISRCYPIHHP
jgi:hypothetical protein